MDCTGIFLLQSCDRFAIADIHYAAILSQPFQYYFYHFGYIGIFIWFITVDQLAPLPEEITLILIGYLSAHGLLNPVFAGVFSVAAFVTVDMVYFHLTKSGNKIIGKLTGKLDNKKVKQYGEKLKRNMFKTLLILCFIPRMRLFGPVFVALSGLRARKFLVYDIISLSIFTSVYISIGIIFHTSLSALIKNVEKYQNVAFAGILILMIIVTVLIMRKVKKPGN